jgi:hypothetical protein
VPKYAIRLESPDLVNEAGDPHFREVRLSADDESEAVARCEQKERVLAAHRYPDDDEAAAERGEDASDVTRWERIEAECEAAGEPVPKNIRARLATHRQTKPYEVVSVEEV